MTRQSSKKPPHPMQPVVRDRHGVIRFKANKAVAYLLDHGGIDLNHLARMGFSREDEEQLAQLIGYSVSGFGDLSYVRPATLAKADELAAALIRRKVDASVPPKARKRRSTPPPSKPRKRHE